MSDSTAALLSAYATLNDNRGDDFPDEQIQSWLNLVLDAEPDNRHARQVLYLLQRYFPQFTDAQLTEMLRLAVEHPNGDMRANLLETFAYYEDDMPDMLRERNDELLPVLLNAVRQGQQADDEYVREVAAEMTYLLPDDESAASLEKSLREAQTDSDFNEVAMAARNNPDVLDMLAKLDDAPQRAMKLHQAGRRDALFLEAIARHPSEGTREALREHLDNYQLEHFSAAVKGLVAIGHDDDMRLILQMVNDDLMDSRKNEKEKKRRAKHYLTAFEQSDHPDAIDGLKVLAGRAPKNIAQQAQAALDKRGVTVDESDQLRTRAFNATSPKDRFRAARELIDTDRSAALQAMAGVLRDGKRDLQQSVINYLTNNQSGDDALNPIVQAVADGSLDVFTMIRLLHKAGKPYMQVYRTALSRTSGSRRDELEREYKSAMMRLDAGWGWQ